MDVGRIWADVAVWLGKQDKIKVFSLRKTLALLHFQFQIFELASHVYINPLKATICLNVIKTGKMLLDVST